VMESTGVYWIPVFEILEQRGFEVMVVNARDAKHVPGRKTDVSDAQWLQRPLRASGEGVGLLENGVGMHPA
jgi:transposase